MKDLNKDPIFKRPKSLQTIIGPIRLVQGGRWFESKLLISENSFISIRNVFSDLLPVSYVPP